MRRSFGISVGFALAILIAAGDARAQNYFQTNGGLYFSGRGGLSQVRSLATWNWGGYDPLYDDEDNLLELGLNDHQEDRQLEMDVGFVVGAAIGYSFIWPGYAGAVRIEGEAIYRRHEDGEFNSQWTPITENEDSISLGHETVPFEGKLDITTVMFNVLVDIPTGTRFTPYLGLGAGYSRIDVDGSTGEQNRAIFCGCYTPPYLIDETIYALSWQAIIGVSFQLSQSFAITLESRYFRLAADRWSELFFTEEIRDVQFGDWSMGFRVTF